MNSQSHNEWESISADPDPRDDLGYVETEWDVIRTKRRRTSHLLFLPQEEQLLKQEAFVIATESAVVDIADYR
jgi:hypothetical protein